MIDRIDYAVGDVDRLVTMAGQEQAGRPIFMLGHSMGATLALAYAIRHQDRLTGLILSGALAALDVGPAPARLALRLLAAVVPALPLVAVDPTLVSRDAEVVSAYVADPLVHHGKLPARTIAQLAAAIGAFPVTVSAITLPVLILYGSADRLCPPEGSRMIHERIGASDKQIRAYDELYHEILNEPEGDQVLADIEAWIAGRLPAPAPTPTSGPETAPA
jgi:acylglycerol lipase